MLFLAFIEEAQRLGFPDDNDSDLKLILNGWKRNWKRNRNVDFRLGTESGSTPGS